MMSMKHVSIFLSNVTTLRSHLSDTSDVLELWGKVQTMWCSLESVFLGGDIARQMPVAARWFFKVSVAVQPTRISWFNIFLCFVQIDKDWARVMKRAQFTESVMDCCSSDVLKAGLPVMFSELERCQKSLDGFLEQKRSKFPRFYFVSDPVMLQILSQSSDPQVGCVGNATRPYVCPFARCCRRCNRFTRKYSTRSRLLCTIQSSRRSSVNL